MKENGNLDISSKVTINEISSVLPGSLLQHEREDSGNLTFGNRTKLNNNTAPVFTQTRNNSAALNNVQNATTITSSIKIKEFQHQSSVNITNATTLIWSANLTENTDGNKTLEAKTKLSITEHVQVGASLQSTINTAGDGAANLTIKANAGPLEAEVAAYIESSGDCLDVCIDAHSTLGDLNLIHKREGNNSNTSAYFKTAFGQSASYDSFTRSSIEDDESTASNTRMFPLQSHSQAGGLNPISGNNDLPFSDPVFEIMDPVENTLKMFDASSLYKSSIHQYILQNFARFYFNNETDFAIQQEILINAAYEKTFFVKTALGPCINITSSQECRSLRCDVRKMVMGNLLSNCQQLGNHSFIDERHLNNHNLDALQVSCDKKMLSRSRTTSLKQEFDGVKLFLEKEEYDTIIEGSRRLKAHKSAAEIVRQQNEYKYIRQEICRPKDVLLSEECKIENPYEDRLYDSIQKDKFFSG